jgi:hypothetical protein
MSNNISRIITVLEKDNVMLASFTNNLAAYQNLNKLLPSGLTISLPSYSTVNRKVTKEGEFIDLATPIGIFVIKKVALLKKGV